jgi:FtsP/CotA-like multicopper oxidase with cupredoxin domain
MKRLLFLLSVLAFAPAIEAKTVHYDLTAREKVVNLSGKETVDFAIAINDQIPAPTLEFTEGDDAEIIVKNEVPNQELSIHWHGILLPPEMDGVPYVTTPTIRTGESLTFKFRIRQSGTYWYHSHTNVQEQKGVYGAFIIHPKVKPFPYDKEVVAVLSDWSDENADSILKNLRKDGDYYLYKKGTMRSWLGGIQAGSLGNFLYNEWTRMGGMDYSDVGYDAFLINGKKDSQLLTAHPGEKVRVRIINAAASTYFHVALGQAPMRVVSADGIDIAPTMAKELLMGMAETYDLLFQIPEHKNYELKITAQDGTGTASGWIGMGEKVLAPVKPFPDMYATMDHGAHAGHGGHAGVDHSGHGAKQTEAPKQEGHNEHQGHEGMHGGHAGHVMPEKISGPIVDTLSVDDLKAQKNTELPKSAKVTELTLNLSGDMERYVWHINGKTISQDRTILINEGEVIRFTFVNGTMMHHPMHLHGHFFRVLNKNGALSPLKHTVDVPPHGTRTIEFYANEPGEWMLHCHNLYHMKNGMGRIVKYLSYTPRPEIAHIQHHDPHNHDHIYFYGMAEAATNHAQAYLRVSQTWNQLEARVESRNSEGRNFSFKEPWEVEGDLFYRRWFSQFFNIVGGATYFNESPRAVIGVSYMLPFLIETQALIDHKGQFRFDVEKRFQWTRTIFSDIDLTWRPGQSGTIESPLEFELSLMYSPAWSWAAGLMLTDHAMGAGVHVQF